MFICLQHKSIDHIQDNIFFFLNCSTWINLCLLLSQYKNQECCKMALIISNQISSTSISKPTMPTIHMINIIWTKSFSGCHALLDWCPTLSKLTKSYPWKHADNGHIYCPETHKQNVTYLLFNIRFFLYWLFVCWKPTSMLVLVVLGSNLVSHNKNDM